MKKWVVVTLALLLPTWVQGFDPMAPPRIDGKSIAKPKPSLTKKPSLVLTQTIVNDQRKVAVINSEVLQEGGMYQGWLVKEIALGSVVLTKKGQKKKLTMDKPIHPVKTRRDPS